MFVNEELCQKLRHIPLSPHHTHRGSARKLRGLEDDSETEAVQQQLHYYMMSVDIPATDNCERLETFIARRRHVLLLVAKHQAASGTLKPKALSVLPRWELEYRRPAVLGQEVDVFVLSIDADFQAAS